MTDRTLFNRVCDMEWGGAPGLVESCGGDALMRVDVLLAVGGYDDALIAAEDNDLCHRICRDGWNIIRLSDSWWQWWQRNRRNDHAGAEAWHRRGAEDPTLFKNVVSNLLRGLPKQHQA